MRRGASEPGDSAQITLIFLTLNLALYLACAAQSNNLGTMDPGVLMQFGTSMPERLWDGEWHRLIAPVFLHGGLMHIFFNGTGLWRLGPQFELYFGSSNFGILYLLSGISGVCFSQIFGGGTSVGASGALFGIMGASAAVKVLNAPVLRYAYRNSEVKAIFFWIGAYMALGGLGLLGNVDNWGHFGGLVLGMLVGGVCEWAGKHGRRPFWGLVVAMVLVSGMIAITRWPIHNPYYHLDRGALAAEDAGKLTPEARAHYELALRWSRTWMWRNEDKIAAMIMLHGAGRWTTAEFRNNGYRPRLRDYNPKLADPSAVLDSSQ